MRAAWRGSLLASCRSVVLTAGSLSPLELYPKLLKLELRTAKTLQLWCAPGNTEMKVAQKMIVVFPASSLHTYAR